MMASPDRDEVHPDRISQGYVAFIAVVAVFTLLSSVSVALRFVQRRMLKRWWWDDWSILGALVLAYGILVTTTLVATYGGAGYHINTFSQAQLETYIKICLANNVIYNFAVLLSRLSILFFYGRIFSIEPVVIRALQVLGFVIVAGCIAAAAGFIFSNSPVAGQWNLDIDSTTINLKAFWVSRGILNIVVDVIILAIPQFIVWKLRLSPGRRVAVSFVFLLGSFVIIASIVRVIYLAKVDVSDFTYEFTIPGIWTCVEMNMSIICACLPVVWSIFNLRAERRERRMPERKLIRSSSPATATLSESDKQSYTHASSSRHGGHAGAESWDDMVFLSVPSRIARGHSIC
ncbi:hypothetical protein CDD83_9904 [Cordyceps sp. RAO-2017]|nr:hypothetical protein CDD83_9904 [Cordyceps sp. RAO-2017]